MLDENAIEKLIQPVIVRQEALNTYILYEVATKIRDIGSLSSDDIDTITILLACGLHIRELDREIARVAKLQTKNVKTILKTVALDTYKDSKPLYKYRRKEFIPFNKHTKVQMILKSANKNVNTLFSSLKSVGFVIRDLKYPKKLKYQSLDTAYKSIINEAIRASKDQKIDYAVAMHKTAKQLVDSGLRTPLSENYIPRIDAILRQYLLNSIRDVTQEMEDMISDEVYADGKEISTHANSAPDHEPFQGHQFTNEEFEKLQSARTFKDVNGQTFFAVERAIGQYNCRHITFPIIVGVTEPRYTLEQLDKFIQKNRAGYTLSNGKHLTMYECTQHQRQLENRIRHAKDEQMMFQEFGDLLSAKKAKQKVIRLTNDYKIFSKSCGLDIRKDRI